MSAYLSMDLALCHARNHRFKVTGSDKTPLKRNLICVTCTNANPGKTAYVAYGDDLNSWGQWTTSKRQDDEKEIA